MLTSERKNSLFYFFMPGKDWQESDLQNVVVFQLFYACVPKLGHRELRGNKQFTQTDGNCDQTKLTL